MRCSIVRRLVTVCVLVGVRSAAAEPAQTTPVVPAFDSSRVARPSPFLFWTPGEIAAARENAGSPALRPVLDRLKARAAEALALERKPFPTDWWQTAKTKAWAETYPEVYLHTCLEPLRVAVSLDALVRDAVLNDDAPAWAAAKEVLLHLATFSFEPEHFDVGMNYSVWGVHVLRAYDALRGRLTADERRQIDDFFTRLGRAVLKNDVYWIDNNIGGGINNHLAWHKMMLGMLGLFYGETPLVDYALHGRRSLIELLEVGLTDDGLWCEGSLVYHFAAIVPMILFADTARRSGHREDLFTMTLADGRTLKQPLDAMLGAVFPDRVIPPVGDAYGLRSDLAANPIYEHAWAAWRDPRHAWLLSQSRERPADALFVPALPEKIAPPAIASRLYLEHGYAFLRSHQDAAYWGADACCAFLTCDRSGVHSNADKLGLMLFGRGRLLLPDVEGKATVPHAFSSRIQNELNRGGLSQNTVMIDGRDQRGTGERLELVEFRDLPAEKRVTAADRRGLLYEGVRQMRTIAMTDRYVLDVFQVACDVPRQIDWITHVLDENAKRTAGPDADPIDPPGSEGAWAWLRDFRAATADGHWHAAWESDGVSLHLAMMGEPGTRIIECGYPATDRPDTGRIPMLIVRRKAAQTVFAAVYAAGAPRLRGRERESETRPASQTVQPPPLEGSPPGVKIERLADREGRIAIAVSLDGARRVHLVPALR